MRASEFLIEAKGVFGRKEGDPYMNDNGATARFIGVQMYPDTKPNNGYKDWDTATIAIDRIEKSMGKQIQWVNRQTPQTKAFAIATLHGDDGELILWGRYYKLVPTNTVSSWNNNELPSGWVFNSKTAKKARSGLTPQDLIRSEMKFTGTDNIIDAIAANGAPEEIINGLRMAALGQMPIFRNSADKLESIRDHLGEIITPIALMAGLISDSNSNNAKNELLKTDWDNCTVHWPQNKNNNLVDSEFTAAGGGIVGISNKGNKGAMASVANIFQAMQKASDTLRRTHQKAVDVIETIQQNNAKEGPIKLAEDLGIIDEYLGREIRDNIKDGTDDPEALSDNAKKLFVKYGSVGTSAGYKIGLVLLANCAKEVAAKLNKDKEFQESCMSFLNQASILQVYTDAKVVGNDVHITKFMSTYPPRFTGGIKLDAGKNYMSTIVKGKFSFDIGKGQD